MCGIAGIVPLPGEAPAELDLLKAMCATMVHRGPDGEGLDVTDGVGLGMRRLAIIDLAGGRQPIFNEDRTVRVVFNGEIYNYRELRAELERAGHRFSTQSDTEVLVHGWEQWGADMPRRLNGMFAFALHDCRRGTLLIARDHFGIKPLYYARTGTHVVFGSEIKVLLASGLVDPVLDLDALGEFLPWEYVPAPRTLFAGVRKLPPAHLLEIDLPSGALRERRWWDVPPPDSTAGPRTPAEWEEAIDAKVREAVRRQLVSDVPLGAFLSGGVDSSLVVSAMGPAHTFSIGFDDPTYSELGWSARVAKALGVRHDTEVIRPQALELFEHLMAFMDDPIGDFSIFPTYLVSRLARRSVTVSLSGDGGDEVFGGYETYVAQQRARIWQRIPWLFRKGIIEPGLRRLRPRPDKKGLINKAKRFAEGLEHDPGLGHARWRLFVGDRLRQALFTPEALRAITTPVEQHIAGLIDAAGARSEIDTGLYVDLRSYLSDNCLVKVDRMSMACSLEARVPLLDPELVELAFRMPPELKVKAGRTKILLKRVAARHLPQECVYRPKEGFSIPMKHWLRAELRPVLEESLAPSRLSREGIFRTDTVTRLTREHLDGRANHSHILWGLLVVQEWRKRWAA